MADTYKEIFAILGGLIVLIQVVSFIYTSVKKKDFVQINEEQHKDMAKDQKTINTFMQIHEGKVVDHEKKFEKIFETLEKIETSLSDVKGDLKVIINTLKIDIK